MEAATKASYMKKVQLILGKILDLQNEAEELCSSYTKKIPATLKALQSFREAAAMEFKELHDFLYNEESSLAAKIDQEEERVLSFLENRLMDAAEMASSALQLADDLSEADVINGPLMKATERQLKELKIQLARYSKGFCGPDVLCSPPFKYSVCKQMLRITSCSVLENLTLDINSAHPNLVVSADLKSVRLSLHRQRVPDRQQRFQPCLYIICSQGFQSSKHYWEVSTGQKTNWVVGVASCHVNRKAMENLSPENGYWVLRKAPGDQFYALSSVPVLLAPNKSPSRIGVLLDYEHGQVGFYNAENMTKICTITGDFQEVLHPFFCPGLAVSEEDYHPLTIHN